MAGAVFGSVELRGVSFGFQARVYELVRNMAREEGFGRNVIVGGDYVEEDVVSDDIYFKVRLLTLVIVSFNAVSDCSNDLPETGSLNRCYS